MVRSCNHEQYIPEVNTQKYRQSALDGKNVRETVKKTRIFYVKFSFCLEHFEILNINSNNIS